MDLRTHLGTTISWVITGGESGPKARPSSPSWFRALFGQCKAAGVPIHVKQWATGRPGKRPGAARRRALPAAKQAAGVIMTRHLLMNATHHGIYIDGFAAPQDPTHLDTWAAKLALKVEPKWARRGAPPGRRRRALDRSLASRRLDRGTAAAH